MDSDTDTVTSRWRSLPECSAKCSMEEDIDICHDVVETSPSLSKNPKHRKKKAKELKRKTGKRTMDARWEDISSKAEYLQEQFVKSASAIENIGKRLTEDAKQLVEFRRREVLVKEQALKRERVKTERLEIKMKNDRMKDDRLNIHRLRTEYQLSDAQLQMKEDEIMFMDTSKLNPFELECIEASRDQILKDHGIQVSSIR